MTSRDAVVYETPTVGVSESWLKADPPKLSRVVPTSEPYSFVWRDRPVLADSPACTWP